MAESQVQIDEQEPVADFVVDADTQDQEAPPTATVDLVGKLYVMTCPKDSIWAITAQGLRAEADPGEMAATVWAFLEGALTPVEYAEVRRRTKSRDDRLDFKHLMQTVAWLVDRFEPYAKSRFDAIGAELGDGKPRPRR